MKKKANRISLDFFSDLKFTEFCVLVAGYLKNILSIQEDEFFKIELSLREALNNAIIHGNKSDKTKRVYVSFGWDKARLYIRIKDENPEKVDFNAVGKRLGTNDILSFNGRGIMIIQSYMDKLEFHPSHQGTEILMEKAL